MKKDLMVVDTVNSLPGNPGGLVKKISQLKARIEVERAIIKALKDEPSSWVERDKREEDLLKASVVLLFAESKLGEYISLKSDKAKRSGSGQKTLPDKVKYKHSSNAQKLYRFPKILQRYVERSLEDRKPATLNGVLREIKLAESEKQGSSGKAESNEKLTQTVFEDALSQIGQGIANLGSIGIKDVSPDARTLAVQAINEFQLKLAAIKQQLGGANE